MAHTLEARLEWQGFKALAPAANAALLEFTKAGSARGLDKTVLELVKIRASQINGCAFCLQMHLEDARKMRIDDAKLNLVAAWRDAPVFSARERAALGWTEALTLLPQGVSDEVYETTRAAFSEEELADLSTAIIAINAWNRLGVGYRFTPIVHPAPAQQTAS
jgi:AhpD family alkylhydroperoxidase